MFRRFLRDFQTDWYYSIDPNVGLNFCVWVLRQDGLQVTPFDRHAAGDGLLRSAGLDARSWRAWWVATLSRHIDFHDLRNSGRHLTDEVTRPLQFSYLTWTGNAQVRELLEQLWSLYAPQGEDWKRRIAHESPFTGKPSDQRHLWQQLKPFRSVLSPPRLFVVEYPEPVIEPFGTSVAVIGAPSTGIETSVYQELIYRAIEALANRQEELRGGQ